MGSSRSCSGDMYRGGSHLSRAPADPPRAPPEDAMRHPDVRSERKALAVDEPVGRLEVGVHQARGCTAASPLAASEKSARIADIASCVARKPLRERGPLDELHGHEQLAVVTAGVMNRHDIRVRDPSGGLSLAEQRDSSDALSRSPQERILMATRRFERGVVRRVHDAHAARAEPLRDDVAPRRVSPRSRGPAPRLPGGLGSRRAIPCERDEQRAALVASLHVAFGGHALGLGQTPIEPSRGRFGIKTRRQVQLGPHAASIP